MHPFGGDSPHFEHVWFLSSTSSFFSGDFGLEAIYSTLCSSVLIGLGIIYSTSSDSSISDDLGIICSVSVSPSEILRDYNLICWDY